MKELRQNDVLAVSSLRVRDWQQMRNLQTSFLSIVEKNPRAREGIPEISELSLEPKRKAMKLSTQQTTSVAQVLKQMENMKTIAENKDSNAVGQNEMAVVVLGKVAPLDTQFFDGDCPIVGESKPRMCLVNTLTDATGTVPVKLWDAACYELLGVTATRLQELWEQGIERPEERQKVLEGLNERLTHKVKAICKIKVSEFGFKTPQYDVQVNVNMVEGVDVESDV